MAPEHSTIVLQADSPYLGRLDPVTRKKLSAGAWVIVCHKTDTAMSWAGWPEFRGHCPYCDRDVPELNPPQPPRPEKPRERPEPIVPPWRTIALAAVILLLCFVSLIASGVFGSTSKPEPASTRLPQLTSTQHEKEISAKGDATGMPTQPSVTSPQVKSPTPSIETDLRWVSLGRSVRNRDISMAVIGDERGTAVVILGALAGTQTNTRDLVDGLVKYYDRNPQEVPDRVTFYLIPAINPDGLAANYRYNANDVDINRNWDTDDWTSNPPEPGYERGRPGAGGSKPFSEPETLALRDLLQSLTRQGQIVLVVVLHSSKSDRFLGGYGEVFPGSTNRVIHQGSEAVAKRFARAMGYSVETEWGDYSPTGEVITWCAEQNIVSIDVVFSGKVAASSLQDDFIRAMLDAIP